jgi:glycerol-3-phosphate dehydrogenase
MNKNYDVIIIGGGVVGSMVARFLSQFQLDIALIEKESDLGMGTTAANSALVHAGYDAVTGSLKAKMNVAANPMWDSLAGELNFPYDRRGDYVVAIGQEELPKLEKLIDRGIKNGVTGMRIVSAEEMRGAESMINNNVSGALWAPTGGICDPFAVNIAAAENAVQNGVTIMLETAFEDFAVENNRIVGVKTNRGLLGCRWAINAAGLFSDVVMHKAGVRPDFKITPRRGEYFILDRELIEVHNVLFPVPTDISKGILVAGTMHGNALVGPNAENIGDKEDKSVTKAGLDEVWSGAQKLIPSISPRHVIAVFAGLRAAGNAKCLTPGVDYDHDFVIEIPDEVQGFVNIAGIESPGLSSAPAIATYVIDLMKDAGEKFVKRTDWNPVRPPRPKFKELSRQEQKELIAKDPRYGRIVCRCETITEGEIVAEIRSPIPARTYDAIKRRTWLGTGRCLGGFDMPRVVDILSRELGVSPFDVSKKGVGSEFLIRKTKEVEA